MKRQRGRGRGKPGGNQGNRSFESNGPDVKIRGNASTVYEKYMQLARDASSSGDRVMAENYFQHADHYFRVISEQQAALIEQQQRRERQQGQQGQHNNNNQSDGGNDRRRNNYRNRNEQDNSSIDQPSHGGQDDKSGDQPDNETPRRGRRPRRQPVENQRDPLEVVDPEAGGKTEMSASGNEDDQPKPRRGRRPRKASDSDGSGNSSGDGSNTEAA